MNHTETRRLRRSSTNRMFSGVCGGLAEYLQVDATLVRVFFVIAAFAGGSGILAYLVLLVFMPAEGSPAVVPGFDTTAERGREIIGIVLVVVGALWFVSSTGILRISWSYVWPIALIALGALILARRARS